MLWGVVLLLLVLWIGRFVLNLVGDLIHLVLLVAVLVALYNLFGSRFRRSAM